MSPTRRTVLLGAAAGAVTLTAAACSSDETSSAPAGTTVTSADGTVATVLTTTDKVPVGGGTVVGDVVVTQPTAGTYEAFSTRCPHAGCAVKPAGSSLDCPCHGSRFSLTGDVEQGPATSNLTPVAIEVRGAEVIRT